MKLIIQTSLSILIFTSLFSSTANGDLGTRFIEFWRYLTKGESLTRHKRITDLVTSTSRVSNNHVSERSVEHDFRQSKASLPNIVTLSSKAVPNDENDSGDYSESGITRSEQDEKGQSIVADATEIAWPKGRYGLPKGVNGCPASKNFIWKIGYRYHDTEDDGTENQHSDNFHLSSNFTEDGIRHEFCMKDSEVGNDDWPPGKYCIYKKGHECPSSMEEGFVIWDDENTDNQNEVGGSVPEGLYSDDTKIYFCCKTDGSVDRPVQLPIQSDFLLFAYQSTKCQKVYDMKSSSEFFKFDDEDHGNIDYEGGAYPYGIHKAQKDHMLFLCYYEPIDKTKPSRTRVEEHELRKSQDHAENEAAVDDQKALQKSEEMMKAFLTATGGEEEESNKSERTRTIIKTIKVPVKNRSYPIAIIVGLVLGGIVISTTIIVLAKYIVNRQYIDQSNIVETNWTQPDTSNVIDVESDDDFSLAGSDNGENELDDLVEDQLLPDSELKSGLELMFLKQQRHYWNQRKSKAKSHDM